MIEAELAAYGGLDDRPRLVVLNKIDVPEARELADMVRADLEARGLRRVRGQRRDPRGPARAVVRDGRAGRQARARRRRPPDPTRIVLRPRAVDDAGFTVTRGGRPVTSSAASSPSAGCGRPTSPTTRPSATWPTGSPGSASRTRCVRPGAGPGDEVVIGGDGRLVVFDWEPTHRAPAPSSLAGSPRGTRPAARGAVAPVREAARAARRIVVKVGSSSLTSRAGGLDARGCRRARRRAGLRPRGRAPRSCWSPPARSRPGSRRWG